MHSKSFRRAEPLEDSKGETLIKVSLETANEYLEYCKKSSFSVAAGVMLCILSPILLIYLAAAGEMKKIPLTEDQGAMVADCNVLYSGSCSGYFYC